MRETPRYTGRREISKSAVMIKMIVWMCYALGTSLADQPAISLMAGVDFAGTCLAIFYSIYSVLIDRSRF